MATSGPSGEPVEPALSAGDPSHPRLRMLDGWRALSILLVLAGHMFPIGPKSWGLNGQVAALGMAIFFFLSGFLIVSILQRDPDIISFLIRRLARIVPLAWLALFLSFSVRAIAAPVWLGNFLFYANIPPFWLDAETSHYWSLCLEMQFYATIALTVLLLGRRGLWLVPAGLVAVTIARLETGTLISIVSWLRADEILAGGTCALVIYRFPERAARMLDRLPFWPIAILFALSANNTFLILDYARPYLAAFLIGRTIVRPVPVVSRLLESRGARYVASVSYAVYIIHHFTMFGWLSSGTTLVKYAKRPLALLVTFGLAHLSTFYFERPINSWSHRLTQRRKHRRRAEYAAI